MNLLRKLTGKIADLFFPRHCPLCGVLTEQSDAPQLCENCQLLFSAELSLRCPICRQSAPQCTCTPKLIAQSGTPIGGRYFVTSGFYRPGEEGSACSRLIYRLKTNPDDAAAQILARLLSREIVKLFAENGENASDWIITYPPRTKKRRQETGFDQAERLARLCARYTGAEFRPLLLRQGGDIQKAVRAAQRKINAENSLFLRTPDACRGRRILLCDDILTSGATLAAGARILRDAGAAAVFFAAAMKTAEKENVRTPKPETDWFRED